ncbi:hypothetical protein [Variovorax sp. dw_954]|uniref:hypothetical protein n=1 Tax=Variovorax sp. dw_954 TaxID=2720078 RepID=UPI001BD1F493|nr:hypothetical protein [Variovorax sp. dw_954]
MKHAGPQTASCMEHVREQPLIGCIDRMDVAPFECAKAPQRSPAGPLEARRKILERPQATRMRIDRALIA